MFRSVACCRTRGTNAVFLRAVEGRRLPAAQHVSPEAGLALGDEVDLAEDGAPQQDVHPGVQDLVPSSQPHAHNHQGSVARQLVPCGTLEGGDHGHQAEDLHRYSNEVRERIITL